MGIVSPFGCQCRYHIIHLLLRLTVLLIVVFALVIPLPLLLLLPLLIKIIGMKYRTNQPVSVCYASAGMKAILLIKPVYSDALEQCRG
jgi:hypothetical protein